MKLKNLALALSGLALTASLSACHDDHTTIVNPGPNPGGEVTITPETDVTAYVDPDFAQALKSGGYIDNAAQIIDSTLTKITVLNVAGNPLVRTGKLTSLKGIEFMTNLVDLKANSQALDSLDLSKNVNLQNINVLNNQLVSLILPQGAPLQIVDAGRNQLTEITVTGYPQLQRLDVSNNQLATLTASGLTGLTTLYINNNQLTAADISQSTAITSFGCNGNPGVAGTFTVQAWFDNQNIPSANFTSGSWTMNGETVSVNYVN